jgi:hypothetical protein
MIHYATAETAEDVAKLLRTRGRIIITAPPRCGKTTELLRFAEDRYPNGRFAVVAPEDCHAYITELHRRIYNGFEQADVVAARLLGKTLKYEGVNPPYLIRPDAVWARTFGVSTPVFVDRWDVLTEDAKKEIIKRRLFIAAVQTREANDAEEG